MIAQVVTAVTMVMCISGPGYVPGRARPVRSSTPTTAAAAAHPGDHLRLHPRDHCRGRHRHEGNQHQKHHEIIWSQNQGWQFKPVFDCMFIVDM